jgi:LysR family transcriptional regulator for metE and metH
MILEVRHLKVIDAVARETSVSRAAETLNLTQPAVSHTLRDLREKLGVELFHRQGKRLVPTAEGVRLLETSTRVLDELRRAEEEVTRFRTGQQGTLRLTTECYTCYNWLPSIVMKFREEFPQLDVSLVEATLEPFRALLEGQLDIALVCSSTSDKRIVTRKIFSDDIVAIVAPGHRLASKKYLTAGDLVDEHIIVHTKPEENILVKDLMAPKGITPKRTSELYFTAAVLGSVKAGLGVSSVARWAVQPEIESGELVAVPLTSKGIWRSWKAAYNRSSAGRPAIKSFVKLLASDVKGAVDGFCWLPAKSA